jgi:uncharacterized membrane protein
MSTVPIPPRGRAALRFAARAWFAAAVGGQLAFAAFIVAFTAPRLLGGSYPALNDKPHITGWVPGDDMGNAQFVVHMLVAAVVTVAGLVQVLPVVRRRWPALHRWNGRLFMTMALAASLTGFYLTWVRGSQLGPASAWSTTLNGVLIVVFALLAWRSALRRDFESHRRHALRAWLLVNGVWFLRIGMVPVGIAMGALGLGEAYGELAFLAVSWLSWTLPILLLQLHLWAERGGSETQQSLLAGLLLGCAAFTALGSVAAIAFMWLPRL